MSHLPKKKPILWRVVKKKGIKSPLSKKIKEYIKLYGEDSDFVKTRIMGKF